MFYILCTLEKLIITLGLLCIMYTYSSDLLPDVMNKFYIKNKDAHFRHAAGKLST